MLLDFNLKQTLKELKAQKKPLPKEYFDLGVAFWLINPDEKEYFPEHLMKHYLRKDFAGGQADFLELYKFASKKLKEYKLEKLFYDVEMPLVEVLADMELAGIKLDLKRLKDLDKKLEKQLTELAKNIYKKTGVTFNLNSPKQLGEVLFKKLKISAEGVKKTRGGAISTDVDTLLTIKDRHPAAPLILDYRELFKLQSTYVRPLQELADKNSRVHTTYIQTGTATGRLSSQNPNLQNIPVSGQWATELRKAFIAEKGFKLAALDYSQIELRILASLSGDPKMIEAFNNDLDIHKMTAARVFNLPLEKVTSDMRRIAKTLNFGISYGMGANAFAKTSSLSFAEAKKFIQDYFANFQKVREWQEQTKAQARQQGFVTNLNGRRRLTLEERAAINMPVQGLAADILKIAMIKVHEKFKDNKDVRLLLTIHDELVFEIKESLVNKVVPEIKKIMESAYELEVPIKVDVKTGNSWGELERH